jgi:epoxide hydrolase 4
LPGLPRAARLSPTRVSVGEGRSGAPPDLGAALVIWGKGDRYLGPELAEPDHNDVPGLDRVERLPGASHWVHHDEAERVNQLLTDFFAPVQSSGN